MDADFWGPVRALGRPQALFRMPEKVWHTSFVANFFKEGARGSVQAPPSAASSGPRVSKPYTENPAFQRTGVPAASSAASSSPARPALRPVNSGSPAAAVAGRPSGASPSPSRPSVSGGSAAAGGSSTRLGTPMPRPPPAGAAGASRVAPPPSGIDPDLHRTVGKVANSPFIAAAGGISHTMRKPQAPQLPQRSAHEQQRR